MYHHVPIWTFYAIAQPFSSYTEKQPFTGTDVQEFLEHHRLQYNKGNLSLGPSSPKAHPTSQPHTFISSHHAPEFQKLLEVQTLALTKLISTTELTGAELAVTACERNCHGLTPASN